MRRSSRGPRARSTRGFSERNDRGTGHDGWSADRAFQCSGRDVPGSTVFAGLFRFPVIGASVRIDDIRSCPWHLPFASGRASTLSAQSSGPYPSLSLIHI